MERENGTNGGYSVNLRPMNSVAASAARVTAGYPDA